MSLSGDSWREIKTRMGEIIIERDEAQATLAQREEERETLREERDSARDLATEAWEWVWIALDAGGWATVFDIPDWKERSKRVRAEYAEEVARALLSDQQDQGERRD